MAVSDDFAVCARCSTLFRPTLGQEWCEKCILEDAEQVEQIERAVAQGYKTLDEITERTGIKRRDIERVLKHLPLVRDEIVTNKKCARCRTNESQVGFDLCLPCRQALFEAFGTMSKQISKQIYQDKYRQVEHVTKVAKGLENAASGIDRRREQTFTSRVKPRPAR